MLIAHVTYLQLLEPVSIQKPKWISYDIIQHLVRVQFQYTKNETLEA